MEPVVNRQLFELVNFDSAVPAGSAAVVHRFTAEGQYVVSLTRQDRVVETRSVTVSPPSGTRGIDDGGSVPRMDVDQPEAVTIDLRESQPGPGLPRPARPPSRLTLSAGGFAAFTGPPGVANRAVVHRVDTAGERQGVEFDTAELGPDDIFALTLLRPGTYGMRNAMGDQAGRIVVTYPVVGDVRYRPADPVDVRVADSGFDPEAVSIGPGQGIVFRIGTRSRLTVDLLEPDDGPGEAVDRGRRKARWRAPRQPGGDPDEARESG
jgi:hypothetical protein